MRERESLLKGQKEGEVLRRVRGKDNYVEKGQRKGKVLRRVRGKMGVLRRV